MLQQPQTQIALMTGQFGFHLFHPLPTSIGALEKLMTDGFSMGISFPPLFFCGSTTFISFRGKWHPIVGNGKAFFLAVDSENQRETSFPF